MLDRAEHPSGSSGGLSGRIATTLLAWMVAFAIVLGVLTVLGDRLESMPHALNALIFTGILVPIMGNLVMPLIARIGPDRPAHPASSAAVNRADTAEPRHPVLYALPHWPAQTVAVLCTVAHGPHAIPVSAPLRVSDRQILITVRRDRRSLTRLRDDPRVAINVVTANNIAITARGTARILPEQLVPAADYAAVLISVASIDDHRQHEFTIEAGIDRHWTDPAEQRALRDRVRAATELANRHRTSR